MRSVLRSLGWLLAIALLLGAAISVGLDTLSWWQSGSWPWITVGELWHRVHSSSLQITQAVVQRYIHPAIWDPIILTVLLWPAVVVFGISGVVLALLTRSRRRRLFT
ncbi:MAG: hypothetical protein QNJ92_01815 [Alphaproteobacteria bacterium]|nr:hypothetical protein [Alphaproteobacteria bacterium]